MAKTALEKTKSDNMRVEEEDVREVNVHSMEYWSSLARWQKSINKHFRDSNVLMRVGKAPSHMVLRLLKAHSKILRGDQTFPSKY